MDAIAFQIKLDSSTIQLPDVGRFLGKDVIVTIVEVPIADAAGPGRRKWNHLGTAQLNGMLDDKNIRDLAYE